MGYDNDSETKERLRRENRLGRFWLALGVGVLGSALAFTAARQLLAVDPRVGAVILILSFLTVGWAVAQIVVLLRTRPPAE